jgi:hypothetical protein
VWVSPSQVISLAEKKHHDIGVLLDRAGLAQVSQLRTLVFAFFNVAR